MAEKRTINIDINNNADEAAKDFENFAKATNIANDSVEGLNKTFEEVYGELQPLTTRMGEAEDRLYELALAGDTTSKEYQELLKNVGNYRKVQIQTDLAVDQAANTFSQKLGGAITGATSGFAAVQGAMALVGSESEALEQTLLKVQGALALQQGVQGVLEYSKSIGLASKATKAFNAIVRLNPLALLVTTMVAMLLT
jgi:chromosome segregation ATPase